MDKVELILLLINSIVPVLLVYLQSNLKKNTEITRNNLGEIQDFKFNYADTSVNSIRCIHDVKRMVQELTFKVEQLECKFKNRCNEQLQQGDNPNENS